MPRATMDQLVVQCQTMREVCGMARLGTKLGLRCRPADAASSISKIRPCMTYLPQGQKQIYLTGPFPFGTLKASVAAALQASGWTARPVQAVSAGPHVQGMMFKVHAVEPPPSKVLSMAHGDIVVTKETEPSAALPEVPKVVAAPCTMAKVSREGLDELQINDPWAKPGMKLPRPAQAFSIGNPAEDMEARSWKPRLSQLSWHNSQSRRLWRWIVMKGLAGLIHWKNRSRISMHRQCNCRRL